MNNTKNKDNSNNNELNVNQNMYGLIQPYMDVLKCTSYHYGDDQNMLAYWYIVLSILYIYNIYNMTYITCWHIGMLYWYIIYIYIYILSICSC